MRSIALITAGLAIFFLGLLAVLIDSAFAAASPQASFTGWSLGGGCSGTDGPVAAVAAAAGGCAAKPAPTGYCGAAAGRYPASGKAGGGGGALSWAKKSASRFGLRFGGVWKDDDNQCPRRRCAVGARFPLVRIKRRSRVVILLFSLVQFDFVVIIKAQHHLFIALDVDSAVTGFLVLLAVCEEAVDIEVVVLHQCVCSLFLWSRKNRPKNRGLIIAPL